MAYTDDVLSILLNGYWYLVDGELPPELSKATGYIPQGGFEGASSYRADVNNALDALSPGRWQAILSGYPELALDDFFTDGTRSYYSKLVGQLDFYQQAVVRYHLLGSDTEWENARRARKIMLRFLNDGIKPRKSSGDASEQRLRGLKGGPARAAALSPERRKEIASKAARARWEKCLTVKQKEAI